jgi:maltose alpha-D-glucosyltransferase/alpha-amylase
MVRLRKECPEIGWGDWKIVSAGPASVLAMRYEWRGGALVILHNFSDTPQGVRLKAVGKEEETLTNLLSNEDSHAPANGSHRIALEAHGYRWYRAGPPNYLLKRSKA